MAEEIPQFTPINLLTGFLGSGKTTLLRRLLVDPRLARTAVLINEFGEIGLDHQLLERIDETMVLLQSGCVCCTIRGELAQSLRDLLHRRERRLIPAFDRVVVESTGLADPFPILSTIKADPVLRHHFRAGTVIATVDAVNGLTQIATHPESTRQAAIADRLVLTKTDLADEVRVARLLDALRQLNPDAPLVRAADEAVDADMILGDAQSGTNVSTRAWLRTNFRSDDPGADETASEISLAGHRDGQSGRIRSFALEFNEPLDWTAFGVWLTMLLNRHGDKVLRVKGILDLVGEDAPVAIHGVQHLVHTPVHMTAWPDADRRSRIVFIVDELDPQLIKRSLAAFNQLAQPVVEPL